MPELESAWGDGPRALLLEPHDLLVRLCAAVPPPWFNMVSYFSVLSSHSSHRAEVVPALVDPPRGVVVDIVQPRHAAAQRNSAARAS